MSNKMRNTLVAACGEHMPAIDALFEKMGLADETAIITFTSIFLEAAEKGKLPGVITACQQEWEGDWKYQHPKLRAMILTTPSNLKRIYSRLGLR